MPGILNGTPSMQYLNINIFQIFTLKTVYTYIFPTVRVRLLKIMYDYNYLNFMFCIKKSITHFL